MNKTVSSKNLLIDPTLPLEAQNAVRSGARTLADGVPIILNPSSQKTPVYRKYEAVSSAISDTQHGQEWVEQATAHAKLGIVDGNTEVSEEDGLILTFIGRPEEEVAIDLRSNRMYRGDDIEEAEEISGGNLPRYIQYNFYLDSVVVTDGPARRAELSQTTEQRRLKEQGDMFATISAAFKEALGSKTPLENPSQEMIDAAVAKALSTNKNTKAK